MTWQSVEKGIRTRRKNLEIKKRSSHETHALERRLLRATVCTFLVRSDCQMQRVLVWSEVLDEDISFAFEIDTNGCPIVSDELNAALVEALREVKQ